MRQEDRQLYLDYILADQKGWLRIAENCLDAITYHPEDTLGQIILDKWKQVSVALKDQLPESLNTSIIQYL